MSWQFVVAYLGSVWAFVALIAVLARYNSRKPG